MSYKEILESLGYKLTDRGAYWHTNAVFRSGDNFTALQVYKDSGVWKDFVEDSSFKPFEALIEKTLGTKDKSAVMAMIKAGVEAPQIREKNLLKEEKTYPRSCLKRLLPHYDFYLRKGISVDTLKDYYCGLSTGGKMYQRIIFPIFRKDGEIHGFSGRKVFEDNRPKWLHTGRVADWFYPYYTVRDVERSIVASQKVFLVESIGDSLALFDAGIKNNLVSFGLNISPKFIAKLSCLSLESIVICFNNDEGQKRNRGRESSVKTIFKLSEVMDFKKLYFIPPSKNDFGAMTKQEILDYQQSSSLISHQESMLEVINAAKQMIVDFAMPKTFSDSLKRFSKTYAFHYD